ncbi:MAG: hypothetical protein ACKOBG_11285 [Actinomycetota bacterium]
MGLWRDTTSFMGPVGKVITVLVLLAIGIVVVPALLVVGLMVVIGWVIIAMAIFD